MLDFIIHIGSTPNFLYFHFLNIKVRTSLRWLTPDSGHGRWEPDGSGIIIWVWGPFENLSLNDAAIKHNYNAAWKHYKVGLLYSTLLSNTYNIKEV